MLEPFAKHVNFFNKKKSDNVTLGSIFAQKGPLYYLQLHLFLLPRCQNLQK